MAHISGQTYTRAVPAGARVVTGDDGDRYAEWTGRDGKPVRGKLSADGKRCTVRTGTLYVHYRDHLGRKRRRSTKGKSARAAERQRLDIEDLVADVRRGEAVPSALLRADRTLTPLLEEWERHLAGKERGPKYVRLATGRVRKVLSGIGATLPRDINAGAVEKWLAELRKSGTNFEGKATGATPQTHNHYLGSVRSFVRWMVRRGYLDGDPLAELEPLNADTGRAFERRGMTDAEFWKLVDTAEKSTRVIRKTAGPDRAMCYMVAGFTGLRLNELGRLTPASFVPHGDQYRILLPAKDQKNRKELPVFLPAAVAARLRPYLEAKPSGHRLWDNGGWASNKQARVGLYRDLEAAGIPIVKDGKRLDFHSLRTHFQTSMLLKGVPVPHATRLARLSSPSVMMKHYARLGLDELAAEVEKLAPTPGPRPAHDGKRTRRKK